MVGGYRMFSKFNKFDSSRFWLKWYDTIAGEETASFPGQDNASLQTACFAPDGRTLAAVTFQKAGKTQLSLFGVPEQKLRKTVVFGESTKEETVHGLSPVFSPDSKWLAIITQVLPEAASGELDPRDAPQARIHLIETASGEIRETLIAP